MDTGAAKYMFVAGGMAGLLYKDQLPPESRKVVMYGSVALLVVGGAMIIKDAGLFGLSDIFDSFFPKAGKTADATIPTAESVYTKPGEVIKPSKQAAQTGGIQLGAGLAVNGNIIIPADVDATVSRYFMTDTYDVEIELENRTAQDQTVLVEFEGIHNRNIADNTTTRDNWGETELKPYEIRRVSGKCSTGDMQTSVFLFEYGRSWTALALLLNGVRVASKTFYVN